MYACLFGSFLAAKVLTNVCMSYITAYCDVATLLYFALHFDENAFNVSISTYLDETYHVVTAKSRPLSVFNTCITELTENCQLVITNFVSFVIKGTYNTGS